MKTEYEVYLHAWRQRVARQKRAREERRQRATACAQQAAEVLVREFAASEVWAFGSMLREDDYFNERSDIDLAVRGILPAQHFQALAAISRLCNSEFDFDLVPLESCADSLRHLVQQEGRRLA